MQFGILADIYCIVDIKIVGVERNAGAETIANSEILHGSSRLVNAAPS